VVQYGGCNFRLSAVEFFVFPYFMVAVDGGMVVWIVPPWRVRDCGDVDEDFGPWAGGAWGDV